MSHGQKEDLWEVARGRRVVAARDAVSGLVTKSRFYPDEGHVITKPANIETRRRDLAAFFAAHL